MVLKANPWPALFNRNSYTTFWSWKSNNKVTETQFKCISNNWNTMQVQGSLFQFLRLSDKLWKYVSLRSITYLLTYSSSFPLAHRSSTRTHHLALFCAVPFVSFHVKCFLSSSAILVRRQVCWGLPLFRLPVPNNVLTFHCPILAHAFGDSNFIGGLCIILCFVRCSNRMWASCTPTSDRVQL